MRLGWEGKNVMTDRAMGGVGERKRSKVLTKGGGWENRDVRKGGKRKSTQGRLVKKRLSRTKPKTRDGPPQRGTVREGGGESAPV